MHRSIGVAAAVAVTVIALGTQTAVPAGQRVNRIDSRITLRIPQGLSWRVHGRVESRKHACEVRREVKFLKRRTNRPAKLVIKDKTGNDGEWWLPLGYGGAPGIYYAKVLRSQVDIGGTTFLCQVDRSRAVDVH